MRVKLVFAAVAAYAALGIGWSGATSAQGLVPTDKGPVRGVAGADITRYLGIPYAAPPVADLRWRPPQPAAGWQSPLDASHFAPHCPQLGGPFGTASTNEDCLYLNVWTPTKPRGRGLGDGVDDDDSRHDDRRGHTRKKKLPVMVWIHGGGFVVGESDSYDPSRLVKQGVVVVTINYRLGYLGFLAHPALSAEAPYAGSGDYGLMDQQAALRWVERNIRRFGGNPEKVTIFGESAGGVSVLSQLASPLAADLFDRAIAQSGSYSLEQPSLSATEASGQSLASSVGCADQSAACLRAVPVSDLLPKQSSSPGAFVPNVDGYVLPRSVKAAFDSGEFNHVPVIEGTTSDEFTLFYATEIEFKFGVIPSFFYPIVVSNVVQTIGLHVTPAEAIDQYPLNTYPSVALAISAMATDAVFACPSRRTVLSLSQPASCPYGAYHGSELPYLFDSPTLGHAPLNPDQESLAAAMVSYWTRFARSGNPGPPPWPAFTVANTFQSLVPPTPHPDAGFAAAHKCAFWEANAGP
jgi:para-nitrobenzyl esterase